MITTSIIERRFDGDGITLTFPADIEGVPDAPTGAGHVALSILDAEGGKRPLAYGADFSYSAIITNGFSKSIIVTLFAPLPAGKTLVVKRTTPVMSISSYPDDKTPSKQVERDFDNAVMIMQEFDGRIKGMEEVFPPLLDDLSSLHAADAQLARDIADEAGLRVVADDAEAKARAEADAAEATKRSEADAALGVAIGTKAGKIYVDSELAKKADSSELHSLREIVDAKAPKTLASATDPGLMSSEDKNKIDSIGIATADWIGLVKPDNITTMIDPDGTLHAIGGSGGGTIDHRALANREAERQHPDTAITRGDSSETVNSAITALETKATETAAEIAENAVATAEALALKAPLAQPEFAGPMGVDGKTIRSMAFADDAPANGKAHVRKNNTWAESYSFPLMVGQVTPYFGAVGNTTAFEPNFLYADGRAVSRTGFPELFAAYGTLYGAGDGTTTFNVPDLRGVFVRGIDQGRGMDPGRVLGALQGDAIRNITGDVDFWNNSSGAWGLAKSAIANGAITKGESIYGGMNPSASGSGNKLGFDASLVVPTAAENLPVNMPCHWFVIAQSPAVASSDDFMAAVNAVNASTDVVRQEILNKIKNYQILHVQEQQPSGVGAGTFTAGEWRTRNLNAIVTNTISGASLDATTGKIMLPAGHYTISGRAPAYTVDRHQTRLSTDLDESLIIGTLSVSNTGDYVQTDSMISGMIVLTEDTGIYLQHICQSTRSTYGMGTNSTFGSVVAVYSQLQITRME